MMVTAGQPRQCYRRSIRNPARACRSFNSVIWLSLAGTMFATVVTRRWSSLTVYHGCLAVRSVAYFMEERPVVFEWQNGDVLPGRATCRVLAMSRGPPLRTSVGRCACPTPSAVSVHPALRVGISGAELIGQEYIRNVPVFGEVLSGCRCLATRLERVLGRQTRHSDSSLQLEHSNVYYNAICVRSSHSPCCSHGLGTRYQRHRVRLDVAGYQQLASHRGAERNQNGVTWLEIFWNLDTLL